MRDAIKNSFTFIFYIQVIALTIILFSRLIFSQDADDNRRSGFAIIYSTPLNDEFKHVAGSGIGVAVGFRKPEKFGHMIGSLEYIRFEKGERKKENYYQINLNVHGHVDLVKKLGFLFGCVGIGYHNWTKPQPLFGRFSDISSY